MRITSCVAVLFASSLASAAPPSPYAVKEVKLPGGGPDGIFMDYLAFDAHTGAVWVPAGNTGAVDVFDIKTGKVAQVTGFPTHEMERRGKKRIVGPSSATVGDGVVYVGNRGDFTVCAIDEKTLKKGACGKLDSMPDGIAWVAATGEVWVTTPRDQTIRILDGKTLAQTYKLGYDGEPEGFAVDATRKRFYTNLEDKDKTLAIDLATHKIVGVWEPGCGEEGPHGLALDEKAGYLFVACSTRAEVMDVGHDGAVKGKMETGDGVDNLDYSPARHEVYVGSAATGTMTVARVDAAGALSLVATVPTVKGARNGVVDARGAVYLACTPASELVVATPAK